MTIKRKLAVMFLTVIAAFCLAFGFAACDNSTVTVNYNTDGVTWTWNGYESATATFPATDGGEDKVLEATVIGPVTTKEATCTETGINTYTATVMLNDQSYVTTKTEEIAAKGHSYDSNGICSVCGAVNSESGSGTQGGDDSLLSAFLDLLNKDIPTGFTVAVSDVEVKIALNYNVSSDGTTTTYSADYTEVSFDTAALYFDYSYTDTVFDGEILVYGEGNLTMTTNGNTRTYEASLYGDGEYFWIYYKTAGNYDDEFMVRVSYDYIMIASTDEATVVEMKTVMEYMANIASLIRQDYSQVINSNLVSLMTSFYDQASSSVLGQLMIEMLVEALNSGADYTINFSFLSQINDDLYKLSVSQLIDKYLGSGTYDGICSFAAELGEMTVYQLAVYGLDFLESNYGMSDELVFAVINFAGYMATGAEFDIESLLADTDPDTTVIGEMTVAGVLDSYVGFDYEMITSTLAMLDEVTVYNLINADDYYSTVKAIVDAVADSLSITIGVENGVFYTVVDVDSFSLVIDENYSDYPYLADFTITISFDSEIPENCGEDKAKIESLYADIVKSIKTAVQNTADGKVVVASYSGIYWGYERYFELNSDGTVSYTYCEYESVRETWNETTGEWEYEYEYYSYTLENIELAGMVIIGSNCTGAYRVEADFVDDGAEWSVYFYIDTLNNVISMDSFHDYELIDNPEGYATKSEAECGEYYYVFYKCTICGDTYYYSYLKNHYSGTTYESYSMGTDANGNTVEIYQQTLTCLNCGEITETYYSIIVYDEYNNTIYIYEYEYYNGVDWEYERGSYVYNESSVSITDSHETVCTYNSDGYLTAVKTTYNDGSWDSYTYTYDSEGNRTSMIYEDSTGTKDTTTY